MACFLYCSNQTDGYCRRIQILKKDKEKENKKMVFKFEDQPAR